MALMTNNKQQTAVELFIEELEYKGDLRETPSIRNIQLNIDTSDYMELKVQAKEMYQEEIDQSYRDGFEFALINECAKQSTSEANKYAEGYKEGYKRAVDYMKETLKNKIEVMENANNEFRKGTANTTHTTFLCTEFVSDQLFYKGTLPHCMRCGKPQYQHPIISNTI
jgi:flagellar biosynthesis/type III secretory pathway protein FliH